jgi:hypothetical protein
MNCCGVSQEKIERNRWLNGQHCTVLRPDGIVCNCPFSAHPTEEGNASKSFLDFLVFDVSFSLLIVRASDGTIGSLVSIIEDKNRIIDKLNAKIDEMSYKRNTDNRSNDPGLRENLFVCLIRGKKTVSLLHTNIRVTSTKLI